jgi:hypothetical protein
MTRRLLELLWCVSMTTFAGYMTVNGSHWWLVVAVPWAGNTCFAWWDLWKPVAEREEMQ